MREPTLNDEGQIIEESETETAEGRERTRSERVEMKPLELGGVLFVVEN